MKLRRNEGEISSKVVEILEKIYTKCWRKS